MKKEMVNHPDHYNELKKILPKNIDWSGLSNYENTDMTIGSQTLACTVSGGCEI